MNTISINCRLQWIALIVLWIHCYDVSARHCPQGQIEHQYSPRVGTYQTRCCYPTRCGVGKAVMICTTNGTQDTCQTCNQRYNQSLRTSSYTMERCEEWNVNENCKAYKSYYDKATDWQMKRCMCDIELGLMYESPESSYEGAPADTYCQRMKYECQPGEQPTVEGRCEACPPNYFKAGTGFTLCEPKTNCTMLGLKVTFHADSKEDDQCSEPEPVTTQTPIVTEKSNPPTPSNPKQPVVPSVDTSPTSSSTTSASVKHAPSEAASTSEDKDIIGPVIGSILFVVVVILVIIIIFFYKRQRGKSFCCGVCAKKCADSEIGMTSFPGDQRTKNVIGGGSIPHHLNGGDKVNNNINGGHEYMPVPQGQNLAQSFFPQDPPVHSYTQIPQVYPSAPSDPTTRRGILRNVVIAQTQSRHPEFESMGPEKLHIPMDRSEPNHDLGENDPLLIPETPRGAAAFQNFASTNSPPVLPGGRGPAYISSNANYGNIPSSPPPHGHGSPQNQAPAFPTFTRSTSVIANPEGEVDEEAIEARVPRFSQLLPDGDTSSVQMSYPNHRALTERAPSNGQVTTQIRAPTQRVSQQPVHNPQTQQKRPANKPAPQRQGYTPINQSRPQENLPDHCIMNLKEQQLAESLHSSSGNSSSSLPLNGPVEVGNTDTLRTTNLSSGTQQTELKTQNMPVSSNPFTSGARADVLLPKAVISEAGVPSCTELKQTEPRDNGHGTERISQPSAGNNGQNLHEIRGMGVNAPHIFDKRGGSSAGVVLLGAGNNDNPATLDRWPSPGGEQQKSCIRTSPVEEANTPNKKQRYNRTVSFDEDDLAQTTYKHNTRPPDVQQSGHGASVENPSRVRAPHRSVSEPEQKILAGNDAEDEEETERKCVSLEYKNSSTTSSKTSVSSDVSGSDSNSGSPSRAALYRRSQSENAPSSSDTAHKPPPRSMSEEKPQKADRPVAKVKPMPATDKTTSNQTNAEGADLQAQIPVTVSGGSPSSTDNILSYSSEDSDTEDSDSSRPTRLDEEEEEDEEEESDSP